MLLHHSIYSLDLFELTKNRGILGEALREAREICSGNNAGWKVKSTR